MARLCTVCHSPHIADIIRDLGNGVTDVGVAQRYGLSRTAVQRHRKHARTPPSHALIKRQRQAFAALAALPSREEVGAAYGAIGERIDAIAAKAESEGSLAVALMGLKELRTTLRAQAEIAGHVGGGSTVQVAVKNEVNIDMGSAIKEIVAILLAGGDPPQPHAGGARGQPDAAPSTSPPGAVALERIEAILDGQ
jgi:hypothetical protein